MPTFEELLATWDGEAAVIRHDRESGAWIFVCLHSTRLGPAGGGTRVKVYTTPAEALEDAMRLSGAMTRKLAVAGLPLGGGKGVLAVRELPSGEQRRNLLLRYGELVAALGGTYRTSSDMNTGEADMDVIAERTEYVFGRSAAAGGSGNPAPPTAVGVFHGIRASLGYVFGVAGSANNQLADTEAAELLLARGILYAPDYVINGGGAIALVGLEQLGWNERDLDAALERIGQTLRQIYERAEAQGISTAAAAEVLSDERLRAA